MASNTRVEWAIKQSGVVWAVPKYVSDPQEWARITIDADGGSLMCRTITTTDWMSPTDASVEAQAWLQTAGVSADRKFVVAVKALRAETGWMLLETMTALDTYLARVGLSRTGVPDADSLD